jgi:hypothetical protein
VGMCDRRGAGPLLPRLARSAPPGTRTPYLPHQLARAAPACPPSLARSLSRAPRRRAGGEGRAGARWSSACSGRARGWWWSRRRPPHACTAWTARVVVCLPVPRAAGGLAPDSRSIGARAGLELCQRARVVMILQSAGLSRSHLSRLIGF